MYKVCRFVISLVFEASWFFLLSVKKTANDIPADHIPAGDI